MRPSSVALLFELQELTASTPPEAQVSFLSPRPEDYFRSGVVKNRYHSCWYCKRQTHPTMEEHELCCKYDSYREVSLLMIKAYTLAFLLLATVVLWTAGDACLYFGFSYLDNRYSGWNRNHQGIQGLVYLNSCWSPECSIKGKYWDCVYGSGAATLESDQALTSIYYAQHQIEGPVQVSIGHATAD